MSSTVKRILGGIGLLLVVVLLVAAWLLGFFTPEPDEVSLAETVAVTQAEAAEPTTVAESAATEVPATEVGAAEIVATEVPAEAVGADPAPGDAGSLNGDWQVVSGAGTFAGYRASNPTGEAVGRTSAVVGSLVASGNVISAVEVTVDMTQLGSDSRVRDDHLGDEGIEWRTYPEAMFVLADPIDLPAEILPDQEFGFDASGMLTVREITQPVIVSLDAALVGEQLVVVGSTPVSLDDFGAGIGGVNDDATIEFSLVFGR